MNNKKIKLSWFVGGLLLFAYAAFVKITGKFFIHEECCFIFLKKEQDIFSYYINLIGSSALGVVTFYRSLLFIPSNKKYWDEYPEYHRRRIEYQRQQLKVNPVRLLKVIFVIILIFLIIMFLAKILSIH